MSISLEQIIFEFDSNGQNKENSILKLGVENFFVKLGEHFLKIKILEAICSECLIKAREIIQYGAKK